MSQPPQPPGTPPKKVGFFASLSTAAREIAHEVRKDLHNVHARSGKTGATAGIAGAPPATVASPQPLAVYDFSPGTTPAASAAPPLPVYAGLQKLLLNPWPHLRDEAMAAKLQTDAYFHPYTPADVRFYAEGILPQTDPEIVSMVAVEAGEAALVDSVGGLFAHSPGVFGSIGFNPRNLQHDIEAMDTRLTDILNAHPQFIAIGPVGVDANYSPATLAAQQRQLRRQLEIAADFDVPVFVFHNKALEALRAVLDATVLPKRMIWLKPIRTTLELDVIQQHDMFVLLRAELTHPKEVFYQNAVRQVLPQRLLIGSGNSLNAVHHKAGQFNSALSLPDILKAASQCLGQGPLAIQARVNENFATVFAGAGERGDA